MEYHLVHQKIAGSIPGRGAHGRQLIGISLLLPLLLTLKKSINLSSGEDFKKRDRKKVVSKAAEKSSRRWTMKSPLNLAMMKSLLDSALG